MLLWCPKCPGTWSRPSCDLRVTRTLPGCNSRLGIFARRKPPRRLLRLTRARRLRWTRGIETSTLRFLFHSFAARPFSIPIAATATQQRRFLAVLSVVVVVLVRTTTERSTHTYYIYIHTRSSLFLSSLLKRARAAARNRKKI